MIKKLFLSLLLMLFVLPLGYLSSAVPVQAAEVNLISNPSVESIQPNLTYPTDWYRGRWGTNTVSWNVATQGQSGKRSVYISMTRYISGDAKWYFKPVSVTGGKEYTFSDYYRSSVSTELVAQFTDTSGVNTYQHLGAVPKNLTWGKSEFSFAAPSNAKTVTVFHLINKVGYLATDSFSLIEKEPAIVPPTPPTPPTPPDPPTPPTPPAPIITDNIANNSLEQESNSEPLAWHKNSWGNNTYTFSYLNEGHSGNRSVKTEITSYTNGDAKWYFEPVALTSGKEYTFGDYYRSNIATDVVAQFTDLSGANSYQYLGSLAASSAWARGEFSFLVPANTKLTTVFHLVNKVGYLITDSYSLLEKTTPPLPPVPPTPVITDNVPNNSLEQSEASLPLAWSNNAWGVNNASFTYLNEGHSGSHSVKTEITSHTDGDAKWYFEPQKLNPSTTYQFSDFYKSSVVSRVVLAINKTDGTTSYLSLRNAEAASLWTEYKDTFTTPADISSLTVFHLIASVGWLITDDYSIKQYQSAGFSRPLISLTFDDGWEENFGIALPLLNQYGYRSTQYYATTFIEQSNEQYKISAFSNSGHEIGSHSVTHPFLTKIDDSKLNDELSLSKLFLENLVGSGKIKSFATPYGDYDARVLGKISQYYSSHRSTDAGYNTKESLTPNNIRVQNMTNTTTLAEFNTWVNKAKTDNAWLVLVYHRITGIPGQYDTKSSDFVPQLESIKNSGVSVLPVSEALAELLPQT